MSLVEKALRKMQESVQRPSAPAVSAQPTVYGTMVSGSRRAAEGGRPAPALPERVIEINVPALRTSGLLPPEHQERELAQQYRQIKRPLIAHAMGRDAERVPDGHLIMVASAMPGEGKTFTAINLAFSMARERDISVVLVDADIPKPHITKLFGLTNEPGLIDLLEDPTLEVESLILPTSVRGLYLLPAGRRCENATELLASGAMRELARKIGRHDPSRIVLFDSPPLLLTTESPALAQVTGQIVVIVHAAKTSHTLLQDALSRFEDEKAVSLVLNQSTRVGSDAYHYYGYNNEPPLGGR